MKFLIAIFAFILSVTIAQAGNIKEVDSCQISDMGYSDVLDGTLVITDAGTQTLITISGKKLAEDQAPSEFGGEAPVAISQDVAGAGLAEFISEDARARYLVERLNGEKPTLISYYETEGYQNDGAGFVYYRIQGDKGTRLGFLLYGFKGYNCD